MVQKTYISNIITTEQIKCKNVINISHIEYKMHKGLKQKKITYFIGIIELFKKLLCGHAKTKHVSKKKTKHKKQKLVHWIRRVNIGFQFRNFTSHLWPPANEAGIEIAKYKRNCK